jgi:hypothetical protein
MEDEIDLFEYYETLPHIVQTIILGYDYDNPEKYKEADRLLQELAPYGYTFEYGLCGEPHSLQRLYNTELRELVLAKKSVNVVTTGLDMNCDEVICYGVLTHNGEDFIYTSDEDGISGYCNDNICDCYVRTPENIEKLSLTK